MADKMASNEFSRFTKYRKMKKSPLLLLYHNFMFSRPPRFQLFLSLVPVHHTLLTENILCWSYKLLAGFSPLARKNSSSPNPIFLELLMTFSAAASASMSANWRRWGCQYHNHVQSRRRRALAVVVGLRLLGNSSRKFSASEEKENLARKLVSSTLSRLVVSLSCTMGQFH
jgi:hypothetical protein